MEKTNFNELMKRYLTGEVTEEERTKIEAWLEVIKTDDNTTVEFTPEEEEALFQKITGNEPVQEKMWPHKRKINWQWPVRIAASLLLIAVVGAAIMVGWNTKNNINLLSHRDAADKIILTDGTIVWLRNNAKLSYYEKQEEPQRIAQLSGDALFEVAKDPDKPFIIEYNQVKVQVVGTSFNIQTSANGVEVAVLTGKVKVSSANGERSEHLKPLEKIVISEKNRWSRHIISSSEVEALTRNTEYNMAFNNATLEEVMQRLGNKFSVKINFNNPVVKQCRITADFTDQPLTQTLSFISEVMDVSFSQSKSEITVQGNGCQN